MTYPLEAASGYMRTQLILFGAILASTAMMGVVALVAPTPPAPPESFLYLALAGVSVCVLVVSFVLPATLEKKALAGLDVAIETRSAADPSVPSSLAKHATARIFADGPGALRRAVGATQVHLILRLALRESVAIYGLVLAFLGFPYAWCVPFVVVALLAQLPAFPSAERVARALEAAKDARFAPAS